MSNVKYQLLLDSKGNPHNIKLVHCNEYNIYIDGKYYKKTFRTIQGAIQFAEKIIQQVNMTFLTSTLLAVFGFFLFLQLTGAYRLWKHSDEETNDD